MLLEPLLLDLNTSPKELKGVSREERDGRETERIMFESVRQRQKQDIKSQHRACFGVQKWHRKASLEKNIVATLESTSFQQIISTRGKQS